MAGVRRNVLPVCSSRRDQLASPLLVEAAPTHSVFLATHGWLVPPDPPWLPAVVTERKSLFAYAKASRVRHLVEYMLEVPPHESEWTRAPAR